MGWLYILLIVPLFIWFLASACFRFFFIWLSKKLREKLDVSFTIGRIYPTYLEGISVEKEGLVSVHIQHVGFSSKWINSQCNKPFTLYVGPFTVHVLKTFGRHQSHATRKSARKKDNVLISPMAANTINFILKSIGVVLQDFSVQATLFDTVIKWTSEVNLQSLSELKDITFEAGFENCKLTCYHHETPLVYMSHNLSVRMTIPPGQPINGMSHVWRMSNLQLDLTEDLMLFLVTMRDKMKQQDPVLNGVQGAILDAQVRSDDDEDTNLREENKLHSLLNSFPQGLKLSMENCKIVYHHHSQRELRLDWNCVLSWQRSQPGKNEAVMDILGFVINGTDNCKLLLFKQMMVKLNVFTEESCNRVELFNKMDTCHIDYINTEISFWKEHLLSLTARRGGDNSNSCESNTDGRVTERRITLLTNTVLVADNVLENCSCDLYEDQQQQPQKSLATLYLGKLHLAVSEGRLEERCCRAVLDIADIYAYVCVVEIPRPQNSPLPCQLEEDQPAVRPSSERHAWGRVVEVGKITVSCDVEPDLVECRCDIVFVACEWSVAMGYSVIYLLQHMSLHTPLNAPNRNQVRTPSTKPPNTLNIITNISNINFFAIGEMEGGHSSFLIKADSISVVKGEAASLEVQGVAASQLQQLQHMKTGDAFPCRKSETFLSPLLTTPTVCTSVESVDGQKVTKFEVGEVAVNWNTNAHMAIYEHISNTQLFYSSSKEMFGGCSSASQTHSMSSGSAVSSKYSISLPQVFVRLDTNEKHSFSSRCRALDIDLHGMETSVRCEEVSLLFDDRNIFTFTQVEVKNVPKNVLSEVRSQHNLVDNTNRTWSIALHSVNVSFPYQFNFAKSLTNFQLIIKWLKLLHKKKKVDGQIEPVPPDLIISCRVLRFMLDDDPFEVKLGFNYVLLGDVMEVKRERERAFEEKLEEIKIQRLYQVQSSNSTLTRKQIKQKREQLEVLNSNLYINRSREEMELRETLFLIEMKDIKLTVLADTSLHGKDNVVKLMQKVNPESPIPENIQFSTLWARMTLGEFESLEMLIRDYPQPLLSVEKFSTKGLVAGAEACGIKTAMREGTVHVGHPWPDATVAKNMLPIKFYYDLKWDMSGLEMAYGANAEPAMAMIQQSMDLISKPSLDPSKPLPFWDKIRLLLHGNLKLDAAVLNMIVIASADPQNTSEKLEILWTAATVEWTNRKISIDGSSFDMTTHTASKYDESRLCHFPNCKMMFEITWLCGCDADDHHNVYPTNPKYVTTDDHDSYADFRSWNYKLSLAFHTCMDQTKEEIEKDPPFIFLYASTFRWFQSVQSTVINRVSRPIKRGKYYNNVRQWSKPTLGRHLKVFDVNLMFPSLKVTYWGSYDREIGVEATIGEGSLEVMYQVFISEHPNSINLNYRRIANWIIRNLRSHLDSVQVSVLQGDTKLDADDGEDETLCIPVWNDEDAEKKHYLFSVDSLDYKRVSTYREDSYTHKIVLENFRGAWTAINRELVFRLFEAYSKMQRLKKVLSSDALKLTSESNDEKKALQKSLQTPSSSFTDKHQSSRSPTPSMQSGQEDGLLQQLVAELGFSTVRIDLDMETAECGEGVILDDDDEQDVLQRNWHIELINSQVLLHGTETGGAIIVTSENALIKKRLHHPVNVKEDVSYINKMNKVTWRGKLKNLQCFSTTEEFKDITVDNIPWLTTDIIGGNVEDISAVDPTDITFSFMKSSNTVGGGVEVQIDDVTHHLQRVIGRTEMEFRFLNLDLELDPAAEEYKPEPPMELSVCDSGANIVDLKVGKMDMSTSNSQYSVVLDICQNLIFVTEEKKIEGREKLEKMKYQIYLNPSNEDIKNNVSQLQTRVREILRILRHQQREFYNLKKKQKDLRADSESEQVMDIENEMDKLQEEIEDTKQELSEDVEALKILVRAYKDYNNSVNNPQQNQKGVYCTRKKVDVRFDDLQWSLTKDDGHLTMAYVHIKKFRYNQVQFEDNSTEHTFEVGDFALKNKLPNELYLDALVPQEINIRRGIDKMVLLRFHCRVLPAVAGVKVKDHFEVNVCPIKVQFSHNFVHQMESFFFPSKKEDSPENAKQDEFKQGLDGGQQLLQQQQQQQQLQQRQQQQRQEQRQEQQQREEQLAQEQNEQLIGEGQRPEQQEDSAQSPLDQLLDNESEKDISQSETASVNIPPIRPPPPNLSRTATFRRKGGRESMMSLPECETVSLSSSGAVPKSRRPMALSMTSVHNGKEGNSTSVPVTSPLSPSSQLSRNSSFRRSNISLNSVSMSGLAADPDRDVNTMKERAAKNQTFNCVKITEVSVCFSYKGEKDRNIEDAHNFNLCLPDRVYHGKTWTWQDLFQALKKEYSHVILPQLLKEKLHLKSAGADTKPSIAKDNDSNKARLLLGENPQNSKKSAKKLFGKLPSKFKSSKPSGLEETKEASASTSNLNETNELSGKGVEPTNLQDDFKRLRVLTGDKGDIEKSGSGEGEKRI